MSAAAYDRSRVRAALLAGEGTPWRALLVPGIVALVLVAALAFLLVTLPAHAATVAPGQHRHIHQEWNTF